MHYFGLNEFLSNPDEVKFNIPTCKDSSSMYNWANEHFNNIVMNYVGLFMSHNRCTSRHVAVNDDGNDLLHVSESVEIVTNSIATDGKCQMKKYAHLVLELGIMFQSLCESIKHPNKEIMLPIFKVLMQFFKSNSAKSKYADEILRFLIQMKRLSKEAADQCFYSLFVCINPNKCIPVDLQMEHIVKTSKKQIKHMFSNKTSSNILKQSSALYGISEVSSHFDSVSNVLIRSKKHSVVSSLDDERQMYEDLHSLKPFDVSHCCHTNYDGVARFVSITDKLDLIAFNNWLVSRGTHHITSCEM
jgi:hypothetical protein